MVDVFTLSGISVSFRRQAAASRSLQQSLGSWLRGQREPPFSALDAVDLVVREGERVGLVGRNGAGKTTLLRVLAGVITPQQGTVQRAPGRRVAPLLELGIGFLDDLSGRENCALAGALLGLEPEQVAAGMEAIIAFAELQDFIDEPVKNYSSGMYARLAFALATYAEPEVLLVDEIFAVGDEFFQRKCRFRLQQLALQGRTTVYVSHDLDFLITQCERLVWLDAGRVRLDGPPHEVAQAYRAAFG